MMAAMMLRSIAAEGDETDAESLPRVFGAGLATAAKTQLRLIVDCAHARDVLVKAFFEAALIAEAKLVPPVVETDSPVTLSA